MSFDETKQSDKDEIDLVELFRSIWFHKFSLLVVFILSVPVSIMYSTTLTPTYIAETVFEKPSDNNKQGGSLFNNIEGEGLLSVLGMSSPIGSVNSSFYSEIRSESFLKTVILNNANFDSLKLKKFCPLPSKETSRFSLRSLLISLGISENKAPSKSQELSLLVQCVNKMLKIKLDSPESSAYRLSIESRDPNFSANLANQIVEKYFVLHEKKRDQGFQNVKKYLSKVIAEAQLDFTEANNLMQRFILKHSLLMNIKPSAFVSDTIVETITPSPFAAKLNKELFILGQLESSIVKLKKARLTLSNLKEIDQDEIEKVISSTDIQEVLSGTFVSSIAKINNLSVGTSLINQRVKTTVSEELRKLNQQINAIENSLNNREAQTMQLLTIDNRFQELAIDVSKKKLIFEGLKDQLKEKILRAGLANVEQPVLLTKAVPPFSKASPNKTLIVVVGVILSIFLGGALILIRQISLRRVHSLSQLQKISRFLSCYVIKYKHLKQMGLRSDKTVISQSFFSTNMGKGKLGCIIDLSQKIRNNSLASEFSEAIVSLFATDNSKIICLDTSPSKKPFSASPQKNFASNHSNNNLQGTLRKGILTFNDEEGIISAEEVKEIKNKYSDYDKIVCALGANIGDLTKFKFIDQCDFYILIGRSFNFDEYTYKKFSNNVWEKEKKCLGFFLID